MFINSLRLPLAERRVILYISRHFITKGVLCPFLRGMKQMSASREKKNRQDLASQGIQDPKAIREAEEKAQQRKANRLYGASRWCSCWWPPCWWW